MTNEERAEFVEAKLAELGEHFDAVQILGSVHEPDQGGSIRCYIGAGNYYTRMGMAHDWLESVQAQEAANRLGDVIKDV